MIRPQKQGWPSFDQNIAVAQDFLFEKDFSKVLIAALSSISAKRVHIPLHKRGATISYHELDHISPDIVDFYHSQEILNWCSSVVGERIYPTPYNDLSSCSVLIYDKAGDHIRCHYDLNFYKGRHFTALLPLVNTNAAGDSVSSAELFVRKGRRQTTIPTPPNTLVLFEGAVVSHGVTPLKSGERRLILSMTYCANSTATPAQSMQRRLKDIAYFGLRALWA